jgi:hypothetical protein
MARFDPGTNRHTSSSVQYSAKRWRKLAGPGITSASAEVIVTALTALTALYLYPLAITQKQSSSPTTQRPLDKNTSTTDN